MELLLIAEILTVGLGLSSLSLGNKLVLAKSILKELGELITVTYKSIEDDKITKQEIELIIKELSDLIRIFKIK